MILLPMKPQSLLSLSLLITASLFAQSPAALSDDLRPSTRAERPFGPMLRAIDANRDGALSADEVRLAPIALTAFDLDEDGFLLHDEISAESMVHVRRAVMRVAAASRFNADETLMLVLDANHDGVIQPIELANAGTSLRRLDANGDGVITPAELRPPTFAASAGPSNGV